MPDFQKERPNDISETPAAKPEKGSRGPQSVSEETRTDPTEGDAENVWRHRAGDERNFDQQGRQRHGTDMLHKPAETRSREEKSASIDLEVEDTLDEEAV